MWKSVLAISVLLTAGATSAAVDINQASEADLDGIQGIGPAVSSRILNARKVAPFKDWNDFITRVKGIGPSNAARFSSAGLTVGGAAYPVTPAATTRNSSEASTATRGAKN